MPIRNGEYQQRSSDDIFQSLADELLIVNPDSNPRASSTYTYGLLLAAARTLAFNQEQSLDRVYNSAYIQDASGENLTKRSRELGFIRREAIKATGYVTFSRENDATTDYVIPSGTVVETLDTDPIQFETTESVTLASGTTSVDANIEAIEAGSDGNVGANNIGSMPSPPTGVGDVNNPEPTGDSSVTDTNGDPLTSGRDREDDSSLRDRVLNTDATEEGPSPAGIKLGVQQTEGVISVDVNTNQTSGTVDGLDPYSTEVVVFGGDVLDIALTLSEVMSATTLLRLRGGVNGTKEETTIPIDLLDQDVTVPITRPVVQNLAIEIDVVHDETYDGTVAAKDAIVEYVGGTFADDSVTNGRLLGEDILLNIAENRVEDVDGVQFANITLVDDNGDGSDDSTTNSDGIPIYDVSDSELARVDADDITVTETQT